MVCLPRPTNIQNLFSKVVKAIHATQLQSELPSSRNPGLHKTLFNVVNITWIPGQHMLAVHRYFCWSLLYSRPFVLLALVGGNVLCNGDSFTDTWYIPWQHKESLFCHRAPRGSGCGSALFPPWVLWTGCNELKTCQKDRHLFHRRSFHLVWFCQWNSKRDFPNAIHFPPFSRTSIESNVLGPQIKAWRQHIFTTSMSTHSGIGNGFKWPKNKTCAQLPTETMTAFTLKWVSVVRYRLMIEHQYK